jgi:hypothetical protein
MPRRKHAENQRASKPPSPLAAARLQVVRAQLAAHGFLALGVDRYDRCIWSDRGLSILDRDRAVEESRAPRRGRARGVRERRPAAPGPEGRSVSASERD